MPEENNPSHPPRAEHPFTNKGITDLLNRIKGVRRDSPEWQHPHLDKVSTRLNALKKLPAAQRGVEDRRCFHLAEGLVRGAEEIKHQHYREIWEMLEQLDAAGQ